MVPGQEANGNNLRGNLFDLLHDNAGPASVAQLDAPSDWRPGGCRFNPPLMSATFFRRD